LSESVVLSTALAPAMAAMTKIAGRDFFSMRFSVGEAIGMD
jgi:hypothetical protein